MVEEPPDFASVTVLPGTAFAFASRRVTVTVAVVPSAVTEAGAAPTVEAAALGVPGAKGTAAVWGTVGESGVSGAGEVVVSATVSLTVKVATPEAFVMPETVVIVEEPPDFARVTVFAATGVECESFSVTVIVAVLAPSAATELGAALTVDCAAVGVPSV